MNGMSRSLVNALLVTRAGLIVSGRGRSADPVGGNDQRPSLGLLVVALAVLRQPLIRNGSALVAVAFAATLWSSAALSQAEAETEVAPSQPVETVPTAPPAPSRVVPDEPAASTPPVIAPNESAPSKPRLPVRPRPPQLRSRLGLPPRPRPHPRRRLEQLPQQPLVRRSDVLRRR